MISIFGKKWKLSRGSFTFVFVSCSHSNPRRRRLINWFGWLLGQDRWPHYARLHNSTRLPGGSSIGECTATSCSVAICRSRDLESAFEKGNGSPIPQIYVCHMLINVKATGPTVGEIWNLSSRRWLRWCSSSTTGPLKWVKVKASAWTYRGFFQPQPALEKISK